MARRRDFRAEAARRNELARERGYASYYQERLARARRAHPRISTAAARGHASPAEREVNRLLRTIKRLPPDAQVAFTGLPCPRCGGARVAGYKVDVLRWKCRACKATGWVHRGER